MKSIIFSIFLVPFHYFVVGKLFGGSYQSYLPHVNNFGQDLIEKLDMNSSDFTNVLISPFSIESCLLMVAAGADGDTFLEFRIVLRIQSFKNAASILEDEKIKKSNHGRKPFVSSNSVWVNRKYEVYKNYTKSIKETFDSSVFSSSFSPLTVTEINTWVSLKTHGKIRNVIDSINSNEDMMLLINALYFKGKWKNPFKPSDSFEQSFYRNDGSSKRTMFMHSTRKYDYFADENIAAAVFPFSNGPRLLVMIPQQKGADALASVVWTYFANDKIELVLLGLKNLKLAVKIPRFDFSYSLSLSRLLYELGLKSAFRENAYFPYISNVSKTYLILKDVLHQTVFSMDEIGVKAAAVTVTGGFAGAMPPKYIPPPPIPFEVDRPYAFVLLDGKTALFIGIIRDVWN